MGLYDRYVLPHIVNCVCGSAVIEHQRRLVVPSARGRVLEIGFGSGLNLAHYDRTQVKWIWALEPSAPTRELAAPRISRSNLDVRLLDLRGEDLPLPDESVDTVVMTYTLCTIPGATAALKHMRRVLRPGGKLLFCEHGAAPDPGVRRWQDRLDPLWNRLTGGCHLNRPMTGLITASGFRLDDVQTAYLPGTPKIAGYNTCGTASPGP